MPYPHTRPQPCEWCTDADLCTPVCAFPDCHHPSSPPSPAGAVETLAAPAAPVTGENTRRQHNYLQWLHVVLFLGLDVEPRRRAKP
jgi:hypothetical protein